MIHLAALFLVASVLTFLLSFRLRLRTRLLLAAAVLFLPLLLLIGALYLTGDQPLPGSRIVDPQELQDAAEDAGEDGSPR